MADHYTGFSEMIKHITAEEQKWIEGIPQAESFEEDTQYENEDQWKKALVIALETHGIAVEDMELSVFPNFEHEIHDHHGSTHPSWWIYTEEWAHIDHAGHVVQAFIRKFRPDYVFKLTWCEYCSKPRIGEFGGGWMVASKDEIVFGNTWEEADNAAEELRVGWGSK